MISLLTLLSGGIYVWAYTTRDIRDLQQWRAGHNNLHKERLAGEID
jgi:hypothetical protein